MANNFCQNCGSALVMQDGKLVCPTCGSMFAMNWDKDDVARAQEATQQERAQAWMDRMTQTSQARAAFQQHSFTEDRRGDGCHICFVHFSSSCFSSGGV